MGGRHNKHMMLVQSVMLGQAVAFRALAARGVWADWHGMQNSSSIAVVHGSSVHGSHPCMQSLFGF